MRPWSRPGRLRLVHQDEWLCPEIELRLYDGHTPGQLCPYLHAAEGTYVYVGDIIPLAASLPLAWVSAYDVEPLRSMTAKERLLCEAADKGQILFFEHDATTECGTVQKVNGRYRFTPCPPMPPTGSVPACSGFTFTLISPFTAHDILPVSSDTTMAMASVASATPSAARWRNPSRLGIVRFLDTGNMQPAAWMRCP